MKAWACVLPFLVCAMLIAQTRVGDEEFEYNRKLIKSSHSFQPKDGYVPNAETASAIAYAVALPIYGSRQLEEEKPFRAQLLNGTWTVLGTLNCKTCVGGTLVVQVDQMSGKILFLTHTQ
jgi:hypothetical protein